jgi:DNA-binding transcriptional LysR family regulator
MDFRNLRYFVAVAEERGFRRAAQRLHVSQPAVSQQVRKLEEDLGVQLIERTPRRVALTPAGEAFLVEARRILQQVDHARRSLEVAAAS